MSAELGVWTTDGGGFVATGYYTRDGAESALSAIIGDLPEVDRAEAIADLAIVEVCPDHEEEPADGCEECADDDDDAAEGEDDNEGPA